MSYPFPLNKFRTQAYDFTQPSPRERKLAYTPEEQADFNAWMLRHEEPAPPDQDAEDYDAPSAADEARSGCAACGLCLGVFLACAVLPWWGGGLVASCVVGGVIATVRREGPERW